MSITITLIVQALAFIVTAWIVMKFGWPHILAAIEDRQKKIADGLAAADRGQKDLDEAKARAAEIVREARDRAVQIVDQANRRSSELIDEAKTTAVAEGERLVSSARAEIATESAKARDGLRREVGSLVVAGAGRLLGREVDAGAHAELIDQLASQIERG